MGIHLRGQQRHIFGNCLQIPACRVAKESTRSWRPYPTTKRDWNEEFVRKYLTLPDFRSTPLKTQKDSELSQRLGKGFWRCQCADWTRGCTKTSSCFRS